MIRPDADARRARQLVLDLARAPSYDPEEFLVSPSNAAAHAAIEAWPDWPERTLLLLGPAGSGKSHLGAIWADRAGARIVTPTAPFEPGTWQGPVLALIEDADRGAYPEAALFHCINLVKETGGWLLVTARTAPDGWGLATPDLLSRLRLSPVATIAQPDNRLLRAVIVKLFADRQIRIDEDVVSYAALHCDQSLEAIADFVAAVDDEALASGRRITRPLAARTLAALRPDVTGGDPV